MPLDEVTTSDGPRSNSIYSRISDRQHWAAEDTAATRGCCTRLAACLGFSATAAPGWVVILRTTLTDTGGFRHCVLNVFTRTQLTMSCSPRPRWSHKSSSRPYFRWAESILPGDNGVMVTRDGWCQKTIDDSNIYASKRRAEQRADRHKHLTQVGRKAEVLVGAQRG